jgi:ATP-dependent RNA helicase DDX41
MSDDDDSFNAFVPLKERRRRAAEQLQSASTKRARRNADSDVAIFASSASSSSSSASSAAPAPTPAAPTPAPTDAAATSPDAAADADQDDDATKGEAPEVTAAAQRADDAKRERERTQRSLVDIALDLHTKRGGVEKSQEEKDEEAELQLLDRLTADRQPLMGSRQAATDERFTQSMTTSWRPPPALRALDDAAKAKLRKKWSIDVEGDDVPPPIRSFRQMRLPLPILDWMKRRPGGAIKTPTPIQMQGIPVALSGRDMVGIAFTGSGKTLSFAIPMIMTALDTELKMPLRKNEGCCAMIISPSRELARQTWLVLNEYTAALQEGDAYPRLNTLLGRQRVLS